MTIALSITLSMSRRWCVMALIVSAIVFSGTSLVWAQHSRNDGKWTNALLSDDSKNWVPPSLTKRPAANGTGVAAIPVASLPELASEPEPLQVDVDDAVVDSILPLPAIDEELERRRYERDEGYQRLRQQLQDLKNRMNQVSPGSDSGCVPEQILPPSAESEAVGGQAEPEPPAPANPMVEPSTEPNLKAVPSELPAVPPTVAITPPTASETSVFLESLKAAAIVDGPVDRIGLADNLYAMNETSIALEMYEKVDIKDLQPSERYWVAYQRASCHRRLGQIVEAQELYRRLAGQQSAGWLAQTSRWWLDQIDTRQSLKDKLETYAQVLEKFKELYPNETSRVETANTIQPGI